MPVVVHHLNNSRSQRILWLLEELQVPYEIIRYERDPQTMRAPPSLVAIHPLGKSPVITDGEHTVAESGAIIEYILEKYGEGRLVPHDEAGRLRLRYFLHYSEGSFQPPLVMRLIFDKIKSSPMPFFARPIANRIVASVETAYLTPEIKLNLDYLEAELGKSQFFAGNEFSAADIQLSFPIEGAASRVGIPEATYPRLNAFLATVQARPAYKIALEKGGPYAYGPKPTPPS
eukprot:Phypoly_transcript_12100.p1 GENE.Phypoly_transcript_12100~~Phypoly_transcript_12100.p1  ORF type:complete len:231 (+),score=37.14 Phypoly_transcript_12100:226-918(+)